MRRRKPDPLAADIVHVREDGRDGADAAGRFGIPCGGVKLLDESLVDAIVGGKDPGCGLAGLSGCLVWLRGHGSLLLDPRILPVRRTCAGSESLAKKAKLRHTHQYLHLQQQ